MAVACQVFASLAPLHRVAIGKVGEAETAAAESFHLPMHLLGQAAPMLSLDAELNGFAIAGDTLARFLKGLPSLEALSPAFHVFRNEQGFGPLMDSSTLRNARRQPATSQSPG